MPRHPISWLLALYGGCNRKLLRKAEALAPADYEGHLTQTRGFMGLVLLTVLVVSSAMAGLAWYSITKDTALAVGVAFGWFALFTVIDRALMQSLDGKLWKGGPVAVARSLVLLVLRLALIVPIAHFNAAAVNLRIFEYEINSVVASKAQNLVAPAEQRLARARAAHRVFQDQWEKYFTQEGDTKALWAAKGAEGADRVREIEELLARRRQEYTEQKQNGPEVRELRDAEAKLAEFRRQAAAPSGLLERTKILKQLSETNPMVDQLYGLFFIIELLAFFVKMFKPADLYDRVTDEKREADKVQAASRRPAGS